MRGVAGALTFFSESSSRTRTEQEWPECTDRPAVVDEMPVLLGLDSKGRLDPLIVLDRRVRSQHGQPRRVDSRRTLRRLAGNACQAPRARREYPGRLRPPLARFGAVNVQVDGPCRTKQHSSWRCRNTPKTLPSGWSLRTSP